MRVLAFRKRLGWIYKGKGETGRGAAKLCGQTNQLYFDKDSFSSEAYVALADWSDKYEYAIIMEDASTILYVYLENITRDDLHMEETYLPAYFQDNNQSESTEESMTAEHRSFYAFKIGSQYVDCMDLVNTESVWTVIGFWRSVLELHWSDRRYTDWMGSWVGKYMKDTSTVNKYYGVLGVYQ